MALLHLSLRTLANININTNIFSNFIGNIDYDGLNILETFGDSSVRNISLSFMFLFKTGFCANTLLCSGLEFVNVAWLDGSKC